MSRTVRVIPLLVVAGVVLLVGWAASAPDKPETPGRVPERARADEAVARIAALHEGRWTRAELEPAPMADELIVLRRLSLALHGTIPSLAEIREFEADDQPNRLSRWTVRMLDDPRFGAYFATRLSRSLVGADEGQFIVFRRDRFDAWLTEQLRERRPYDAMVRAMIAESGLWTDEPATNFVTATFANGAIDYNKLAGRSVRAFLGQRIDCAQCHDHPFDDAILQRHFEGLAAFYGSTQVSIVGIEDDANRVYEIEDRETLEERAVEPAVPYHPEWLPEQGTARERFAAWVTHEQNVRFERAIANRVWGLVFGKPYSAGAVFSPAGRPVDDLPDPPADDEPDVLSVLGADFREHGYDLRRLVYAITATRSFRLASEHPTGDSDGRTFAHLEAEWAVFPLVRLRPEQMIGSMLQAASVTTIDQNSQLVVRIARFFREQDFVREYGDLGEDELEEHAGTIPQALLRMNGNLTREIIEAKGFTASGRISAFSGDPETLVENAFLACLTRRPTAEELAHFTKQFEQVNENERGRTMEDLYWVLFNSPEFAWNH